MQSSTDIRIGTSGWSYEDWVGPFYPAGARPGDWLAIYAGSFDAAEVDSTFYAIPSASTVDGWAERTPERFAFALKVPGTVTHGARGERPRVDKVLIDEEGQLPAFVERVLRLGSKLGCLLFQFPYFRVGELALEELLARLDPILRELPSSVRAAVEIRNKGWLGPAFLGFLRERKAAAVLLDHLYMPGPEEQVSRGAVTSDLVYARLIGDRHGIERKTKTWGTVVEDRSERLDRWSGVLQGLAGRPDVRRIFAFVNNHYAGHAPATCRDLASRLSAAGLPLAGMPPPRGSASAGGPAGDED